MPLSRAGRLDLSDWNLAEQGAVPLRGAWEFYWQKLLTPGDFAEDPKLSADPLYIQMPRFWKGFLIEGQQLPGSGFGTFRLRVTAAPGKKPVALRIPEIASSYKLFVNGRLKASAGQMADNSDDSSGGYLPTTVLLDTPVPASEPARQELEIILQISNFELDNGGMDSDMILGTFAGVDSIHSRRLVFEYFLFGCLVMMGLYHLGLYLLRREDNSSLFFALVTLLGALRIPFSGEYLVINILPFLGFEFIVKINYLSFYLGTAALAAYIRSIFPEELPRNLLLIILGVCMIYSAGVLALPARIYSKFLFSFQALLGIISPVFLLIPALALRKRKQGAGLYLVGGGLLLLSVLWEILFYNGWVKQGELVLWGLLIFAFTQAILLSRKFSTAFFLLEAAREEADRARAEIEKLNEFSREINSTRDLDYILDEIFSYIRTNFNVDYISLDLIDPRTDKFYAYKSNGDVEQENNFGIPLLIQNEVVGFIHFARANKVPVFDGDDIVSISRFCEQITGAIHGSYLFREAIITRGLAEKSKELAEKSIEELEKELFMAQSVQSTLLPRLPRLDRVGMAYKYKPMMTIGGDFVDIHFQANQDKLGFFICDVSGHGVAAAILASMVKMSLRNWTSTLETPAATLAGIKQALKGKMAGHTLTAIVGVIDLNTGHVTAANAGHPPFILVRKNPEVPPRAMYARGHIIADSELLDLDSRDYSFDIARGDKIVLYTDGVIEAQNPQGRFLGEDQLIQIVDENRDKSPEELCVTIQEEVIGYLGERDNMGDDFTLFILEFLEDPALKDQQDQQN